MNYNSWPFKEAERLLKQNVDCMTFMTGYSPSGVIHIGTIAEILRTKMVINAFRHISNIQTRLVIFSDDYDALRKTHDPELEQYMGLPLSSIPYQFRGRETTFAEANHDQLKIHIGNFIDLHPGGFEIWDSAHYQYTSGNFDDVLQDVYDNYDKIMDIMLPTLKAERRATYSPFIPRHPETRHMLEDASIELIGDYRIRYSHNGSTFETDIFNGNVKCQWKVDWAMRWKHYNTNYEMYGKDHIDNFELSSRIVRAIGGKPPVGYQYELFLDEQGQKISKTSGNGVSVEEWFRYAPPECMAYFIYQKPKTAKKLYMGTIPENVDRYFMEYKNYPNLADEKKPDNPLWHVHSGIVRNTGEQLHQSGLSFAMLLNLVEVASTDDMNVIMGYVNDYAGDVGDSDLIMKLIKYAIAFYRDQVEPNKQHRDADDTEREMLNAIVSMLEDMPSDASGDDIQKELYNVARRFDRYCNYDKTTDDGRPTVNRDFFMAIYQVLLGQDSGPRFGHFIRLLGIDKSIKIINKRLR